MNPLSEQFKKISFPKIFRVLGIIFIGCTLLAFWGALYFIFSEYTSAETPKTEQIADSETRKCNVVGINMHGGMVTYIPKTSSGDPIATYEDAVASENIIMLIQSAENDPTIKAIILEVDSSGGEPVAGEEIERALLNAKKPTVAMIRTIGASGAYLASTGADIIFASKYSDVGSIGVTMSYSDNSQKNLKDGITYNQISIGKYKDMGDSEKPLTAEEKLLAERDIKIIYENFISDVAFNRNMDINRVRTLADGSSMPGEMALQNGLIDRIGGIEEVNQYIQGQINEKPEICWE
ncbi:MAG: signal peptide peptidase SppA [bacterium]